jgi:hypothetical protein
MSDLIEVNRPRDSDLPLRGVELGSPLLGLAGDREHVKTAERGHLRARLVELLLHVATTRSERPSAPGLGCNRHQHRPLGRDHLAQAARQAPPGVRRQRSRSE